MSPPPKNIDQLAQCIDRSAFNDDLQFADRFKARREARRLVESDDLGDHMLAGLMLMFGTRPRDRP